MRRIPLFQTNTGVRIPILATLCFTGLLPLLIAGAFFVLPHDESWFDMILLHMISEPTAVTLAVCYGMVTYILVEHRLFRYVAAALTLVLTHLLGTRFLEFLLSSNQAFQMTAKSIPFLLTSVLALLVTLSILTGHQLRRERKHLPAGRFNWARLIPLAAGTLLPLVFYWGARESGLPWERSTFPKEVQIITLAIMAGGWWAVMGLKNYSNNIQIVTGYTVSLVLFGVLIICYHIILHQVRL